MNIERLHHIAIICSDYAKSKHFYTAVLGLKIEQEIYRQDRQSYKLDLSLNGQYIIELFSFTNAPKRLTSPEATGLRHIAFGVKNIDEQVEYLKTKNIASEKIRTDELTQKKFIFIADPDNLPIEFYEI